MIIQGRFPALLTVCLVLGLSWLPAKGRAADNWAQFRGPAASGVSNNSGLPDTWNAEERVAWKTPIPGRGWSSPIVYGDYLYVLYDRGMMACYHARTGEEVFGKRRIGYGARAFTSSPWAYDGKLFCLSEDGDTFVIQAGTEFKILGKNSLGEFCMATPAITRDSLIIRTESHLLRIK